MDTAFTEEQEQLRRTLRQLLARRCGPDEVKAAALTPEGYDTALWHTLAGQLGLPGLALPEAYGGVGCGTLELALAFEEAGRTLLPSPMLPTAGLVAPLIAALGTVDQRARLLPRLASGELTAALAVPGSALAPALGLTDRAAHGWAGGGRAGGVQATRRPGPAGTAGDTGHTGGAGYTGRADAGWRLYGEVDQVLGGHSAGLLLVAAHTGGFARSRTVLFLVDCGDAGGGGDADRRGGADRGGGWDTGGGGGGEGVGGVVGRLVRTRQTALDGTRPVARVQLRGVPATPLGDSAEDVCPALTAAGPGVAAVLAAEAVGAADAALARTVEYVKVREQFGRPVGSFQAVRHRLADVYVQVQAARSAAYYAAWAAGGRTERAGRTDGDAADSSAADSGRADGGRADGDGATAERTAERSADRTAGGTALAQGLEALRLAAAEAVQLHGGVGFTWEHEAHLYFKRAAGDELLFGPAHRLRACAAERAALFELREGQGVAV
ncbi:acyl-CoA dehydrogenase family protein [Streptomyces spirodelae]|uniref:Acyl-CoA dehydrogenase family protein n=1 Tax=Streptomyces spirodelae TaxID=2812904 RepID=A0ABS3WTU9_9ACTN|nr:acyl-CoA dehydrogenase family protein [Streptomyces spirodelae]MBO8186556.1 acyl-CoA dehydrogenase family protein [Streptomyces spirodelae]